MNISTNASINTYADSDYYNHYNKSCKDVFPNFGAQNRSIFLLNMSN